MPARHPQRSAAQQVPLDVERVEDSCVRLKQTPRWCWALEALYHSLPPLNAEMRVLRAVVVAQPSRPMSIAETKALQCGSIRSKSICDGPPTDRRVAHVDATMREPFPGVTPAERKTEVQPGCAQNDGRRKAVTVVQSPYRWGLPSTTSYGLGKDWLALG